ncbi:MAG: sodium:calcium antiporter, partial [Chloroflexi bacterium]|nr:sodium:calcium antiporter [Chloroflexota bacterium]
MGLPLLLVSMGVILVAAELFTNSVEWFGHRMKLG